MTRTSKRLLVVAVAGVAVFAALSIAADVGELGDRLARFDWRMFGLALGLALLNYVLRFGRWTLYLRRCRIEVPVLSSALIFVGGFALSITPGKVGELIKSLLLRETHEVPVTRSAPIVIAERITDLVALLVLGAIGVAVFGIARTTVFAGLAVLGVGLLILSWPRLAELSIRAATATRFTARFRDRLRIFYGELGGLVRPWPLSWATVIAIVAWLAECVGFALIISGFGDAEVPLLLATAIYAATTVAGALSFLPGGLLVTEAGMTLLLVSAARGIDQPTAIAATILTRLATLWFAVVLGLLALAVLRKRAPASRRALQGT